MIIFHRFLRSLKIVKFQIHHLFKSSKYLFFACFTASEHFLIFTLMILFLKLIEVFTLANIIFHFFVIFVGSYAFLIKLTSTLTGFLLNLGNFTSNLMVPQFELHVHFYRLK